MLESFVRANLPAVQNIYDRFPAPARNVLTSARGWLLTQIRYAPATFEMLRELQTHEAWPPEQIAAHQLSAIQLTLDHARSTVPFYKGYSCTPIRRFEDLRRLPVIKRETVRENQRRLLSNLVSPTQRIQAATTGTTGANLKVAYTQRFARVNWAFLLRQWAWAGVSPRQPRITFYGARVVPADCTRPPYWVHNLPERQILMSIFHLSEQTAPAYLDFLRAHRAERFSRAFLPSLAFSRISCCSAANQFPCVPFLPAANRSIPHSAPKSKKRLGRPYSIATE